MVIIVAAIVVIVLVVTVIAGVVIIDISTSLPQGWNPVLGEGTRRQAESKSPVLHAICKGSFHTNQDFLSAATLAQLYLAATISSRPFIEVEREVILVDEARRRASVFTPEAVEIQAFSWWHRWVWDVCTFWERLTARFSCRNFGELPSTF